MDAALTTLNLYKICRVCLAESEEMHSIFSEIQSEDSVDEEEPTYIYEMLMNISAVRILTEDRMPTMICSACLSMANSSYRFQQQCNRSQAVLEAYITQVDLNKVDCIKVFSEIESDSAKDIDLPDAMKIFDPEQVKEDELETGTEICLGDGCFDEDAEQSCNVLIENGALESQQVEEMKLEIKEEQTSDTVEEMVEEEDETNLKDSLALKRTQGVDGGKDGRKDDWTEESTRAMLDLYHASLPKVGPMKEFRTKRYMWEFIAGEMARVSGIVRTWEQCSTRYKTVLRRKNGICYLNQKSEATPTLVEHRAEIASTSDGNQHEVVTSDSNPMKNRFRREKRNPRVDVLLDIHKEREANKQKRHENKMDFLRVLKNDLLKYLQKE